MTGVEIVLAVGILALILGGLFGYQWFCSYHELARARRHRQWVQERQQVLEELERGVKPPTRAPPATDLTRISGVGPQTAARLEAAGYSSVERLAQLSPQALSQLPGFGPTRAQRVLREARRLVRESARG